VARVEFTKMHGAGNDFILIDDRAGVLDFPASLIKGVCALHTGVGADGLIIIGASDIADFSMRYYNSDGGEAELCGNGARCTALFAYLKGIAGRSMSFETASGIMKAEVDGGDVAVSIADVTDVETDITLEGVDGPVSFGVCGVPHAMVLADDVNSVEDGVFVELGRKIRYHDRFAPSGTNFNLVSVLDEHTLRYRTYERGVENETLACGTGAVTVSVLCASLELVRSPVRCITRGGDTLEVEFELKEGGAGGCRLTGPAVVVFEGYLETENFG